MSSIDIFLKAARQGDSGKVMALLKDDPYLVYDRSLEYGETALHVAAGEGYKDLVELLLANKALVEAKATRKDIRAGWTALHFATEAGRKDVVEFLVAKGANINARDDHFWTPLHWAATRGYKDVVESLLNGGANVNAGNAQGWTPLDQAVRGSKKADVAEVLRQHGGQASNHAQAKPDLFDLFELLGGKSLVWVGNAIVFAVLFFLVRSCRSH